MNESDFLNKLRKFLTEANKAGYAAGDAAKVVDGPDGSHTITHESADGRWKYHDEYYGGEPYGGREIVFLDGKGIWMMVYYGWVVPRVEHGPVYKFLQEALRAETNDEPYRGPRLYESNGMKYVNSYTGAPDNFRGEEEILRNGARIYFAWYGGGLINQ